MGSAICLGTVYLLVLRGGLGSSLRFSPFAFINFTTVAAVFGVSWVTYLTFGAPGESQAYFLAFGYLAIVPAAAEGVALIREDTPPRAARASGFPAYLPIAMTAAITAVVVSFADPAAAATALQSLLDQSLEPIEVLVVDNDPQGATARALAAGALAPSVRTLHSGVNLGYTGAANRAAREARGEWLFFLNPDATAAADCLARLLDGVDGPDVAVVGAQVLLPDGRINAGGNPVNIAGISWSGGYGRPREHGPARDSAAVSGAALLVRRDAFLEVGGLCPHFFMYYDDTDLAWRMRLGGRRVRYCPEAVVVHDYQFDKGAHKWFYLERNRAWALLSNLQLRTLALLAPVLLITEVFVLVRATSQGWLAEKARAWVSLLANARELIRWRRAVQGGRHVSDYAVLDLFVGGIETDLIDTDLPRWVNPCMERYRRLVLRLLGPPQG
jgi:GT2 family glycosyltransferase